MHWFWIFVRSLAVLCNIHLWLNRPTSHEHRPRSSLVASSRGKFDIKQKLMAYLAVWWMSHDRSVVINPLGLPDNESSDAYANYPPGWNKLALPWLIVPSVTDNQFGLGIDMSVVRNFGQLLSVEYEFSYRVDTWLKLMSNLILWLLKHRKQYKAEFTYQVFSFFSEKISVFIYPKVNVLTINWNVYRLFSS